MGRGNLLTAQQAHTKGQEKNQCPEKTYALPPHLCLRDGGTCCVTRPYPYRYSCAAYPCAPPGLLGTHLVEPDQCT
jgi:hypothetical protein